MKRLIIFAVALVATFVVSMKIYSYDKPIPPNYYCVYFGSHGRCYIGIGDACYGIDKDCNWLE